MRVLFSRQNGRKSALKDGGAGRNGCKRRVSCAKNLMGERRRGQDSGRLAKQGDFCVESAGKKEKMGPQAAKISMEEASAAEAAKEEGKR